jgi:hypothetical protein
VHKQTVEGVSPSLVAVCGHFVADKLYVIRWLFCYSDVEKPSTLSRYATFFFAESKRSLATLQIFFVE